MMMEIFKRLDGMKSYIGLIAYGAGHVAATMGWMDPATWAKILPVVVAWTGIGIAHKLDKAKN